MAQRTIHFSRSALPPGLLTGLLLGIAQSLLVALVPVDVNTLFVFLVVLMLLLYLLVPLFALLFLTRKGEQAPGNGRVARRIGATCASLVIASTLIVWMLSTFGVQAPESGGFLSLRLMFDNFFSFVAIVLLNVVGLILSLLGGKLGGVLGARRVHSPKEQRL